MDAAFQSVRASIPATTANLGPGFDCLGLALAVYSELELVPHAPGTPLVQLGGPYASDVALCDERNLAYRAASRFYELAELPKPDFALRLTLNAPVARGLGSSAGAIAGAMMAANASAGTPVSQERLLREMVQLEGHPDNIVPCIAGGLTASLVHNDRVLFHKFTPAESFSCVVLIPGYPLPTSWARRVIPKRIPFRDAAFNVGRMPFVVAKLVSGELDGLGIFMEDRMHQPYRKAMVREYDVIVSEAEKAGAAAVCLSGAGPAMLAICSESSAKDAREAMLGVLAPIDSSCEAIITRPDKHGIRIAFL